jgi:hypothetical protein
MTVSQASPLQARAVRSSAHLLHKIGIGTAQLEKEVGDSFTQRTG